MSHDCQMALELNMKGACPKHSRDEEVLSYKLRKGPTDPKDEYQETLGSILKLVNTPKSNSDMQLVNTHQVSDSEAGSVSNQTKGEGSDGSSDSSHRDGGGSDHDSASSNKHGGGS